MQARSVGCLKQRMVERPGQSDTAAQPGTGEGGVLKTPSGCQTLWSTLTFLQKVCPAHAAIAETIRNLWPSEVIEAHDRAVALAIVRRGSPREPLRDAVGASDAPVDLLGRCTDPNEMRNLCHLGTFSCHLTMYTHTCRF